MTLLYRVVLRTAVCGVVTEGARIIETAPLLQRFLGQPISNLARWVQNQRGTIEALSATVGAEPGSRPPG